MPPENPRVDRELLAERLVSFLAEQRSRRLSFGEIADGLGVPESDLQETFGSRLEMLGELIPLMGVGERRFMAAMVSSSPEDEWAGVWQMWDHAARTQGEAFGATYFEVATEAMYGTEWAVGLREEMRNQWADYLAAVLRERGVDDHEAGVLARLGMAVVRGLIFELALGADRRESDEVMAVLFEMVAARIPEAGTRSTPDEGSQSD